MAVLGGLCFGLMAAILEFSRSVQIKHLTAAMIAVGSLAQIASIVFLALEIKAWKEQVEKH
jgi:hypothetical protein